MGCGRFLSPPLSISFVCHPMWRPLRCGHRGSLASCGGAATCARGAVAVAAAPVGLEVSSMGPVVVVRGPVGAHTHPTNLSSCKSRVS